MVSPGRLTTLKSAELAYSSDPGQAAEIAEAFAQSLGEMEVLTRHLLYVESLGIRRAPAAAHYLCKLMIDELPRRFRLLDLGARDGSWLSLFGLLAQQEHKEAYLSGVAPPVPPTAARPPPGSTVALEEWFGIPPSRRARAIEGSLMEPGVRRALREFGCYDAIILGDDAGTPELVAAIVLAGELLREDGLLLIHGGDDATSPAFSAGMVRARTELIDTDATLREVVTIQGAAVWRKVTGDGGKAAEPERAEKPNLVLGWATNYRFEQIEPFVASVLALGPRVKLCLFTTGMDDRFYEVAQDHGIRVEDARPYLDIGFHPMNSRYFAYQDFLRDNAAKYAGVMVTDVRDLFFQSDPFAVAHPGEVAFAAEDLCIVQEDRNQQWLREIYGEDVLRQVWHLPISCSGTTIGSMRGMRDYLDLMCTELRACNDGRVNILFDQGVHNYVVWKLRPSWSWLDRADTIVNTVGVTGRDRIEIIDGLALIDFKASPVIHQWDRHPVLGELLASNPRYKVTS